MKLIDNIQLMKEWDWQANNNEGLEPSQLSSGSNKKANWICNKGHKWKSTIHGRNFEGYGCPYCSNQKILPGYNDLATTHPELLQDWDYQKNTLKPSEVTARSNRKVWWKCTKGHEYQAKACGRSVLHNGCAKCKAGNQTSFPEQAIFYYIKQIFPDAINRYRDIFDNGMELDIFIPSKNIAIEYDGSFYHKKDRSLKREKIKYNICRQHQIKLIRICAKDNADVFNFTSDYTYTEPTLDNSDNTQGLDKIIKELLYMLESDFGWNPRKQHIQYNNIPIRKISVDVNIARDRYKINAYRENTTFKESLAQVRPDLAAEWDYKKNQGLTPKMFPVGSHEEVWWICKKCGASYPKIIRTRSRLKTTCPHCNIKCKSKQYILYMRDKKTSQILQTFNSVAEAAKKTGICDSNIAGACRGSRKTAGGYIWQKEYRNHYDK